MTQARKTRKARARALDRAHALLMQATEHLHLAGEHHEARQHDSYTYTLINATAARFLEREGVAFEEARDQ